MSPILVPDEKTQKAAAQAEQEKISLHRKKEQFERDEIERLRRIKERRNMVFLSYLKMRKEEEAARQEHERIVQKLEKEFLRRHMMMVMESTDKVLTSLARHHEAVAELLFSNESAEEKAERKELMQTTEVDEPEYCALAAAELSNRKEPDARENVEKIFHGYPLSEGYSSHIKDALTRVKHTLREFKKGDIKKMEALLENGLVTACRNFAEANEPLKAIHWSKQINSLLSVINTHPVLFKNSANITLIQGATGMAAIGRVMENGLNALNQICKAHLNGVQLSPEKEANLQQQVLLMEQSDSQRSNDSFQKFFAKGYHPKKGLDNKMMDKLLKELNGSQAMHELSDMSPDEKLFALCDSVTRKTITEGLFVNRPEKVVQPVKKEVIQQGPASHI